MNASRHSWDESRRTRIVLTVTLLVLVAICVLTSTESEAPLRWALLIAALITVVGLALLWRDTLRNGRPKL